MKKINERAYLIHIILLATILTSITFSRHITTSIGGDDVRVASIGDLKITENGDFFEENKLIIIPGSQINYEAKVEFEGSESSTYIFVEMMLSNSWTQESNMEYSVEDVISFKIANGWNYLNSNNNKYVFYKELNSNETLDEGIIDGDVINVNKNITEDSLLSMSNYNIKFKSIAVQSNEFANPAEAWNSIN